MFLLSLTRSKNFVEILKKTEHTSADRCFHKLQRLIYFSENQNEVLLKIDLIFISANLTLNREIEFKI